MRARIYFKDSVRNHGLYITLCIVMQNAEKNSHFITFILAVMTGPSLSCLLLLFMRPCTPSNIMMTCDSTGASVIDVIT